jgi:hypothetical protein
MSDRTPTELAPTGEFLLFQSADGTSRVQVRLHDGTVWLTQKLMAELYGTSVPNINQHITAIFNEGELAPDATLKSFLIVRLEGSREVRRPVHHYNLPMILAVGYRTNSPQGTLFRQWATAHLEEYLIKGFVMNDERLKSGAHLGTDYFDELIDRIRDIRASERRFYQKITDIYAQCSIDYEPRAEVSLSFFATVQNKLHWAIHGHTAAELIHARADSSQPNMGLTTWTNAPKGKIRRKDVAVAKNYLTDEELRELNRVVTMYLDYADDQARKRRPMRMTDWIARLDSFLQFNERNVLTHAGKISHELAAARAESEFEQYEATRRHIEATEPTSDFDRMLAGLDALAPGRKR